MGKIDLRDFGFGVIRALVVQSRLSCGRVVQYETDRALALLKRQLLKCKNVDILIGESLANLSQRSRPVFYANCELSVDWHDVNLTFDLLGDEPESPARGINQKSYASLPSTTRFRVESVALGHVRTGGTAVRNAHGTYHALPVPGRLQRMAEQQLLVFVQRR